MILGGQEEERWFSLAFIHVHTSTVLYTNFQNKTTKNLKLKNTNADSDVAGSGSFLDGWTMGWMGIYTVILLSRNLSLGRFKQTSFLRSLQSA